MARRAQRATSQSVHLAAPLGGLNAIDAAASMPASDAVALWNLVGAEYGLRSRLGYREWCTGLTGAADNTVRTVLPFTGSSFGGSSDRLFVTTSTGIWDVSSSSAAPSQVLAFASSAGDAGYGTCTVAVTAAGHFLLYWDEVNGYHVYTESTTTWAAVATGGGATQVNGVTTTTLVAGTVWKARTWMVERDSARAWYGSVNGIYGTLASFNFASKFTAGGTLVGLWSWTGDGGIGIDDHLVAVSSGGDVLIFKGTDPSSSSTFSLVGAWNVGSVPAGRQIASKLGGDLLLLTGIGIIPISRLSAGDSDDRTQYPTYKIANLFNVLAGQGSNLKGWSIRLHPQDNTLIVTVPQSAGTNTQQLALSLATKAWSRYRDLPIYSADVWGRQLYFGTADGRVCRNEGYVDNVLLTDSSSYTPVQWAMLSAFQSLGQGKQTRLQWARPHLLSDGEASPPMAVAARVNFDLTEIGTVTGTAAGGNTWDNALWDSGTWGGDYTASQPVRGLTGMGSTVAIAMRGAASSRTVIRGVDIGFDIGGVW